MSENLDLPTSTESESKQRRLVPQFSLNNRQETKPVHHEAPKKPVTRFTREQLIAMRKPSTVLPSMKSMSEVTSDGAQEPVCFTKLEPEDVIRLWNAASKDMAGRGRGRARSTRDDQSHDEHGDSHGGDLWDDGGGSSEGKEFDLSDFSKAALQFRHEMENMKLSSEVEISKLEEDTMEKLIEQQNAEALKISERESRTERVIETVEEVRVQSFSAPVPAPAPAPAPVVSKVVVASQFDVDLTIHKTQQHTENKGFLSSVIGETVFLQSTSINTSSNTLLNPSFAVNSIFQPEPLLYTPPPADPEWFYTDPQKQVQGPFSQENMRLWNEAGYFGKDLPIKLRHWTDFHVFKEVYPDPRIAFYTVPQEPARPLPNNLSFLLPLANSGGMLNDHSRRTNPIDFSGSLGAVPEKASLVLGNELKSDHRTQGINEKLGAPSSTLQQSPSAVAVSNANASRPDAQGDTRKTHKHPEPASVAVNPSSNQPQKLSVEKSDYAKQILGINKKQETHQESEKPTPVPASAEHHNEHGEKHSGETQTSRESKQAAADKLNKGWKTEGPAPVAKPVSFLDIQQQEAEEEQKHKDKAAPVPVQPGTSPNQPTAAMSVQLKSLLGLKPGVAPSPVAQGKPLKGWSAPVPESPNVNLKEIMKEEITQQQRKKDDHGSNEKGRGSSWAAKIGTNQVLAPAPVAAAPAHSTPLNPPKPAPVAAVVEKPTVNRTQRPAEKSDFGGKRMSKELAEWCSTQLKAIKGIEDLTLMEFCMSLNSAAEIRETLASYLGSSPQITNFATEFIKYKEEGKLPSRVLPVATDSSNAANAALAKKKKSVK